VLTISRKVDECKPLLQDTIFDVDDEKERAAWEVDGSTEWTATGDATNGFSFEAGAYTRSHFRST
jgi:hypothetical protein